MKDSQRSPHSVSLEDLIRIKRAERPGETFWADFERELRAKQLAAIMEKAPWWRINFRTFGRVSRLGLPLGASAALVLTLVTIHDHKLTPDGSDIAPERQTLSASSSSISELPAAPIAEIPVAAPPTTDSVAVAALDRLPAAAINEPSASMQTTEQVAAAHTEAVPSVTRLVAGIDVPELDNRDGADRSAFVAARARVAIPELANRPGFRLPTQDTPLVEPLAQVTPPREVRRSRLLAYAEFKKTGPRDTENTDMVRSRERATRRLDDEGLADSIRRLGVSGDSVSIKF